MKERKYPKKDGTLGTEYMLEDGDIVTSLFSQVKTTPVAFVDKKDGKAKVTNKHSLQVHDAKKGDIYLKITDGQAKSLGKVADLKGKTIVGRAYENKFGKQVGVTIK